MYIWLSSHQWTAGSRVAPESEVVCPAAAPAQASPEVDALSE